MKKVNRDDDEIRLDTKWQFWKSSDDELICSSTVG